MKTLNYLKNRFGIRSGELAFIVFVILIILMFCFSCKNEAVFDTDINQTIIQFDDIYLVTTKWSGSVKKKGKGRNYIIYQIENRCNTTELDSVIYSEKERIKEMVKKEVFSY